jgi:hypothetical protein
MQLDAEGLWVDPGPITAERFYTGQNPAFMQNLGTGQIDPATGAFLERIEPQGGPINLQVPLAEPIQVPNAL